ncbi:MAG: sodium-dependent transporter [Lachnospiraceae bacterium]|nr:sodium-dependent transporter [Lachnospiraceae bacterium]
MEREKLGSRLGFILLSAGCAIGLGNVYKFPYMVGENGGGIFVLIYLFFLLVLGVPIMTIEFSMGRAARKSPVMMYRQLEKKGSKWHWHGPCSLIGCYLLMMFYTSVAGWLLRYFVDTARGCFIGLNTLQVDAYYDKMLQEPVSMTIYMGIVVVLGFSVCAIGLQNGLEKITKVMMLALLSIMLVLCVNSVFLDGGEEGIKFYLMPSIENLKAAGVGNVIVSAMNQAFFTLSLGIGSMAVFGSYIDKERSLLGESINIAGLDTFVALASGFIIFPACYAYDVDVTSGMGLIFRTLPNIFNHIPLGRLWGSLFFVFMSFAALSTIFAVFEMIIACTMDLFAWSRKKSCVINGICMFVLSLPCVFGYNLWSNFEPMGKGTNIMVLEDFIVSNLLLPLGSLIYVLFCTSRYGWGWDSFTKEANTGKGAKVQNWMRGFMSYVIPIMIIIVFIIGIV